MGVHERAGTLRDGQGGGVIEKRRGLARSLAQPFRLAEFALPHAGLHHVEEQHRDGPLLSALNRLVVERTELLERPVQVAQP